MQIFILVNAILYLLLGIWCAIKPTQTSQYVGMTLNGPQGYAEYLAVYGGLEFAIGVICLLLYFNPDLHRTTVIGLAVVYACLAAFRSISIFLNGADIAKGWYFFALEVSFLIVSVFLVRS